MFERAFIVDGEFAEDATGDDLAPTERGDDVLIINVGEYRYMLHLRRGMTGEDIAGGLDCLADKIREDMDTEHEHV